MSLSTVAVPLARGPGSTPLPASRPERFERSDFLAAALVSAVTLLVYVLTLSPCVTLEDSGELTTGAACFGVPHPPGYPLWTMSGFLFAHLIPFGDVAWRVNLQSAVYGALANGVLTLLVCHSGRWLAQRWAAPELQVAARRWMFYIGMLAGCVIGFSDVMWSQGTIAEVYNLNGLFVNLVLLLFYFWMLEPARTERLVVAVFVFALGLTNHHTLIQMIPAMLLAAALLQWLPFFLKVERPARRGLFWSVLTSVNLFSLAILVYLSWLSGDPVLHLISFRMALAILVLTAVVAFFYVAEFRPRAFAAGAGLAALFFAYGHYFLNANEGDVARIMPNQAVPPLWFSYVDAGWLQITTPYGVMLLALAMVALGLFFTSTLDRRMVIGIFAAGWVGVMPYAYEPFASSTHPPMNWGVPASRSGFYYAVTRLQYTMSLPNLIKKQIGSVVGVVNPDSVHDAALSSANYGHRLWLTLYYYGDNLQDNFTVPLIFLTVAVLLYVRRCDWRQISWLLFLCTAFFTLGFMLHAISPPLAFDFQNNLQYKVFNLQSHCIFVILMGYGALGAILYLHEMLPDWTARFGPAGFGVPALYLALLPLWSNFDDSNQAHHWFGFDFGHDIMTGMDRNAVYYGGSDFGRFVPTFMAFVESREPARWKRDPAFDRRDVTVLTQNALCDSYYNEYIRQQYDPRFRPKVATYSAAERAIVDEPGRWLGGERTYSSFEKWLGREAEYPLVPVTCLSQPELDQCWAEYRARPDVAERIRSGEVTAAAPIRSGTNDVFEINAIAAEKIFQKNKATHTFYLEQSVPMAWSYPYMLPWGLIFKLSPTKLAQLPPGVVAADHAYWQAYAARLLADPCFRVDDDATLTFGKLALFHADLYETRDLPQEEEYFTKLALRLSPQLQEAVIRLEELYLDQGRYEEALALLRQAQLDDPRNEYYATLVSEVQARQDLDAQEKKLRAGVDAAPRDLAARLSLARVLQEEGKTDEVTGHLRTAGALTNWDHDQLADTVQFFANDAHNVPAAVALLQERQKLDHDSKLTYSLAALEGSLGRTNDALRDLATAALAPDGTNALLSAAVDSRFAPVAGDPRFHALLAGTNGSAAATGAATRVLQAPAPVPLHVPPFGVNRLPPRPAP